MDSYSLRDEAPKISSDPTANRESMQAELAWWLERLKKVDTALAGPALTMIAVARKFVKARDGIPSWITERMEIKSKHKRRSQLVHALCCSTLQRLWKTHRRYAWLTKDERIELEKLQADIAESGEGIIHHEELVKALEDPVFGRLNPFLAAEAFWILLNAGENRVVGGSGLLLIFSMLWALFGTHPPESGFALGDTRTIAASVTAKCLRPIIQLQRMFRTRARLYRAIRKTCAELRTYSSAPTPHRRWQFACAADHLAGLLLEMSSVAINRATFQKAATKISEIAAKRRATEQSVPLNEILIEVAGAIAGLREANKHTLADAFDVLGRVEAEVIPKLVVGNPTNLLSTNLRPPRPDESEDEYWRRMRVAADDALRICFRGLGMLADAVVACDAIDTAPTAPDSESVIRDARWRVTTIQLREKREKLDPGLPSPPPVKGKGTDAIESILGHLAKANDDMANVIEKSISGAAYWCRLVVRQEVAYASAGNDTEFDVAELLSAVGVAESSGHISELEVEDAIVKALRGLRQDGSWVAGQPIFLKGRVLGVSANTSDIAWLLSSAICGEPKIRSADSALMAFVDWLDRTRTDFYLDLTTDNDGDAAEHLVGWSAETRESKSIDFWITAGAVNALIEIRQIIEYRLWELCERRFFVFRDLKKLDAIDPVDLGALHEHRLHHRLRRTARESSGPMYRDAEYSFVFHGPPGSSKTVMAEALGNQMWRSTAHTPRVIRITPADFTRQGEAGLDAEARFIFELLSHIRGVTIIFDEIDDLLRRRELKGAPEFLKMVVPAMLNRLQDLRDAAPRQEICFIIAMNYVDNVEPALVRTGRIDAAIPVVYPDLWSRDHTLDCAIEDRKAEDVFDDWIRAHVVTKTPGWPWPIYKRLAETVVRELKELPSASWEEKRERVERLVDEFRTQKQDTASHYAEKVRWQPISPELINEVAHFAFAFFRTSHECSQQLNKILRSSSKRPDVGVMRRWTSERQKWKEEVLRALRKKLDREWDREQRETYNRAATRRTQAMGATHFGDDDGTAFRVWAPDAKEVRVVRGPGDVTPLRQEAEKIFADEVRGIPARSEYRFEIDREDGSASVHRLDPAARDVNEDDSRNIVIEPSPIQKFRGAGWHELVVYQIHPGTFTAEGTYAAIANRLEGLEDLGINAIDLIAPGEPIRPGEHNYEWQRFRQIDRGYGGLAGLRTLIEAAHARSIAVFIGVTTQELLGRTVADLATWGCYFDGSTPLGLRPVLSEKHVRDLMIENARRWVDEIGVDGIRWAGTHHVHTRFDETGGKRPWPEGLELIRAVKHHIRLANPTSMLIAQDDDPPHHYASEDATSAAFNVLYGPEFERAVRDALQPDADLGPLQRLLSQPEEDVFRHMIFTESPETVRENGRLSGRWTPEQRGRQRAFLGTILSLVSPGIPVLLQGQELWEEPLIAGGVPMKWDPIAGTYRRLKALIALRTNSNGRARGLTGHQTTIDVIKRVLVVDRWIPSLKEGGNGHHAVAVLNFSDDDEQPSVRFPFSGDWHVEFNASSRVFDDRFGGKESPADIEVKTSNDNRAQVDVGGLSAVVLAPARRNT